MLNVVLLLKYQEHKCVLDSCRKMETEGRTVTYLPVDKYGVIDLENLEKLLSQNKGQICLVSIMFVNNEIGTIQPMAEIGALCKKYDTLFHTDAAQALGLFFFISVLILKGKSQLMSML